MITNFLAQLHARSAKEAMWEYFKMLGVPDTEEHRQKIDLIIDSIIKAAVEQIKDESH